MAPADASLAPIRGASSPRRSLPPNSWDTHAHVFGPFDRYPLAIDCKYQPPLATRELYAQMLDAGGFAHGVLVHASANGFDNSAVLDALNGSPGRYVGVAVVPEQVTDAELATLHAAGVRGVRFTEKGARLGDPGPTGTLGLRALRSFAPRLRELKWHAQIWANCEFVVESVPLVTSYGIPLVFDHMGAFDVARGVGDAIFQRFLNMVDDESVWVKLTPGRVSKRRWVDCEDVRPFHDALLSRAPDRMLWGSDWPYIAMDRDLPDVGRQVDLFDSWVTDSDLRDRVFVRNPNALYRHE